VRIVLLTPREEIADETAPRHASAAAPLTGPEDWRSAAACRSADPELFFPISDSGPSLVQAAQAKAICGACPVRRQCLAFALRTRQVHGIWGGLTERERHIPAAGWNSGCGLAVRIVS